MQNSIRDAEVSTDQSIEKYEDASAGKRNNNKIESDQVNSLFLHYKYLFLINV